MNKIKKWLKKTPYADFTLSTASVDASFRKYYRLREKEQSYILMDSSLEFDSLESFINVTRRLLKVHLKTPRIFLQDTSLGYLVLDDFGNVNLLDILNEANFKKNYLHAIDIILQMQEADVVNLPLYDKKFLHFEMDLMQKWYLQKELHLELSQDDKKLLEESLDCISEVVLSQPHGLFVHRDFHSRNIMLTSDNKFGIIDYQDAMNGALTYDLVSLLKDCYVLFKRKDIEALALIFRDKKELNVSDEEFLKWFDFMGLQRHIKVLGVFSRLFLRDKKEAYLKDIPLVLKYTIETASRYAETQELAKFLQRVSQ